MGISTLRACRKGALVEPSNRMQAVAASLGDASQPHLQSSPSLRFAPAFAELRRGRQRSGYSPYGRGGGVGRGRGVGIARITGGVGVGVLQGLGLHSAVGVGVAVGDPVAVAVAVAVAVVVAVAVAVGV
jgi:hypothetical protein